MDKKGILRDTDDKGEDTRVDIEEAEAGSPSSLRREVSMEPIEIEEGNICIIGVQSVDRHTELDKQKCKYFLTHHF